MGQVGIVRSGLTAVRGAGRALPFSPGPMDVNSHNATIGGDTANAGALSAPEAPKGRLREADGG